MLGAHHWSRGDGESLGGNDPCCRCHRAAGILSVIQEYGRDVVEPEGSHRPRADKAARQAARVVVASYHQQELRRLLDHVRDGVFRLDAGEIDEFELDDLIHRYKRAAGRLWSFCGSSGGQWEQAANTLAFLRDRGEPGPDWWSEAAPQHQ
jgi:hypothetical protein